jgi:hypothetical protein
MYLIWGQNLKENNSNSFFYIYNVYIVFYIYIFNVAITIFFQAGQIAPMSVKVGDKVLLPEYGGTKVVIEDQVCS